MMELLKMHERVINKYTSKAEYVDVPPTPEEVRDAISGVQEHIYGLMPKYQELYDRGGDYAFYRLDKIMEQVNAFIELVNEQERQ